MYSVKMYGIMVIYNKRLDEAVTMQSLRGQAIEVVVCDNSTNAECVAANKEIAQKFQCGYIDMQGNQGLSCAYNRGLEYLFDKYDVGPIDRIALFDDDTHIPADYVQSVTQEKLQDEAILLPIMEDHLGIMSPVILKNGVAKRVTSKQHLLQTKREILSGINSAMAVSARIYQNYRYDEEMFLDYIDHKFIMDMRKMQIYPYCIDLSIQQEFSAVTDSKGAARARFRLQKKDLRIFYKKQPIQYAYVVCKKHLKLALKYKDITMLFY